MAESKYLDGAGLTHAWDKIKVYLESWISQWKINNFGNGSLIVERDTAKLITTYSPINDTNFPYECVCKLGYSDYARSGIIFKARQNESSFAVVYMDDAGIRPNDLFEGGTPSSTRAGFDIPAFFICGYANGDGGLFSYLEVQFADCLYDYTIAYNGRVYSGRTTSGNYKIDSNSQKDGKKHPFFGFMIRVEHNDSDTN